MKVMQKLSSYSFTWLIYIFVILLIRIAPTQPPSSEIRTCHQIPNAQHLNSNKLKDLKIKTFLRSSLVPAKLIMQYIQYGIGVRFMLVTILMIAVLGIF